MKLISVEKTPEEIIQDILGTIRVTLKQLRDGKTACEGQSPVHLLVGLHNYLRGLNTFWAELGLVTMSPEQTFVLTPKGEQVEAIIAQREGNPAYSLLEGYMSMQQAGAGLVDLIQLTIGQEPAQYVLDTDAEVYNVNRPVYPELSQAIQSVIDVMEG